jgi:hypothetical protein
VAILVGDDLALVDQLVVGALEVALFKRGFQRDQVTLCIRHRLYSQLNARTLLSLIPFVLGRAWPAIHLNLLFLQPTITASSLDAPCSGIVPAARSRFNGVP